MHNNTFISNKKLEINRFCVENVIFRSVCRERSPPLTGGWNGKGVSRQPTVSSINCKLSSLPNCKLVKKQKEAHQLNPTIDMFLYNTKIRFHVILNMLHKDTFQCQCLLCSLSSTKVFDVFN